MLATEPTTEPTITVKHLRAELFRLAAFYKKQAYEAGAEGQYQLMHDYGRSLSTINLLAQHVLDMRWDEYLAWIRLVEAEATRDLDMLPDVLPVVHVR